MFFLFKLTLMYVCLKNLCKEFTALVFKITVEIVSVIWFLNIMEDCRNFAAYFKRSASKIRYNSLTYYCLMKYLNNEHSRRDSGAVTRSLSGQMARQNSSGTGENNGQKKSSKKDSRKTVILLPLHLASLTHRNPQ